MTFISCASLVNEYASLEQSLSALSFWHSALGLEWPARSHPTVHALLTACRGEPRKREPRQSDPSPSIS